MAHFQQYIKLQTVFALQKFSTPNITVYVSLPFHWKLGGGAYLLWQLVVYMLILHTTQ